MQPNPVEHKDIAAPRSHHVTLSNGSGNAIQVRIRISHTQGRHPKMQDRAYGYHGDGFMVISTTNTTHQMGWINQHESNRNQPTFHSRSKT